jgi:transposase
MDDRIKSRAEQVVEQRTGRELPELLRELYVDKRHTHEEIAEALGVHRVTVTRWIASFRITRDDRPAVAL